CCQEILLRQILGIAVLGSRRAAAAALGKLIDRIWLHCDVDFVGGKRALIEELAWPGRCRTQQLATVKEVKRADKSTDRSQSDKNDVCPSRSAQTETADK